MNEFSLRLPGVIFNVCSIGMIYTLGRCLFDRKVALLSAFLLAFSIWEIELSRYGRMYTLFQFFVLLSIFCFYKGFMIGEKMYRLLTPVVFVVTFSIHAIGLSLLTLFLVPICVNGYKIMKKWALAIYASITFSGLLLYHWGMDRLASDLSRISLSNQDVSEGFRGIDWVLSSVKGTFSLPHIGLFKYLYFNDPEFFMILYSLMALFVLRLGYKACRNGEQFWKAAVVIVIILCASVYQFTLALVGLYVYLFFFQEDLRHFSRSSLRIVAATIFLLFTFWVLYSLNNPKAFAIASFSDTFFGFPNIYQYFARWYIEGFPILLTVVMIGVVYIFREYGHDRKQTSYSFVLLALPLLILFPAFFYSPWYGSRYTFHLYPILIVIFSFVIVKMSLYLMGALKFRTQMTLGPNYFKTVVASGGMVLLAGCLSQDINPAEVLAVSGRSYQSIKDPIKSSINWAPYADFHQDHMTPSKYVKEHLGVDDAIPRSI